MADINAATVTTTGGTAPMARSVFTVTGVEERVGNPSSSNGTGERYSQEVPPTSFSPYIWSIYLSGFDSILFLASARSSSLSPNFKAPEGQAFTQAGSIPAVCLLMQKVHLRIQGNGLSHSKAGTPNGQATMQYRQPIHLPSS